MNQKSTIILSAIFISLVFGVVACSKNPNAEPNKNSIDLSLEKSNREIVQDSKVTLKYADDAAVTKKVNAVILAEYGMKDFDINVETNDGIITLKGTVDSRENKNRAGNLVSGIDGVKSVINKLMVEPKL